MTMGQESLRITFILLCTGIFVIADIECPTKCLCGKTSVDCSFKGFTRVPVGLDPEIKSLDLQGNNITVIRSDYFSGLNKLTSLQLLDNNIETIEPGAFDDLISLQSLRLNRNHLSELPEYLFVHTPQMTRLDLSMNRIHSLKTNTFQGLSRLNELYLDNNALACIETGVLEKARNLEIISLNSNNLTTLPDGMFDQINDLRILRLSDNSFRCDCNLAWLARWLKMNRRMARFTKCSAPDSLHETTITDLQQSQFRCTDTKMVTGEVKCRREPVRSQCPAKCSCSGGVVNCRNAGLMSIPADIPEYVEELRLDQNQLTEIPANMFSKLSSLHTLDLSNNRISDVHAVAFNGLTSLKTLILYENKIEQLPEGIFSGLTKLQMLLLNANNISCLRVDTFDGLTELNLLSLFDNQIRTIVDGTFQHLTSLQTLHLASNPFQCDCNLMWIADYLQKNPVETSGAKCASPHDLEKRRLGSLKQESTVCPDVPVNRLLATCETTTVSCPSQCKCEGSTVDCSSKDLAEIPLNLPSFTTELNLSGNKLRVIPSRAFVSLVQLQKLDLADNEISKIEENAFHGNGMLRELQMTENRLTKLKGPMFAGLTGLRTLMLRDNQITCIDNSTFNIMTDLRLLSLYDNMITCLQPSAFRSLTKLSTLNLLNNPLNCDCHMRWFADWLKVRSGDVITGSPVCSAPAAVQNSAVNRVSIDDFICKEESKVGCQQTVQECCSEDTKVVKTCHPPSVCPKGCTCDGTTVRCSGLGLTEFPANIPTDTTELYLDVNAISQIPSEINRLTHLTSIDLSNNRIQNIGPNQFSNLTKLTTLILSYNDIKCMQPDSLSGLRQLKLLNLYSNDLSTIPYNSFRDLTSLINIVLGENPLWCDCNLKWLADWIKQEFRENGVAKCAGPELLERKLLLTTPAKMFQCAEGYNASHILQKCDACRRNPCGNGWCESSGFDSFTCHCSPGYYGDRCQSEIDACFGDPCENGGTCSAQNGRFECRCPLGFSGFLCEMNDNDCLDNKCQNGATCIDLIQEYECKCPFGFKGKMCETSVDLCSELKPCKNGAQCRPMSQDYVCTCPLGYTDKNCSTNIDDCVNNICQNGAHCIDGIGQYSCECSIGYSGKYCATKTAALPNYLQSSVCQNSDCQNDGVCYQPRGRSEYVCRCQSGYEGKKCEKLQSVSFVRDSYVQAPGSNFSQTYNITIRFTTSSDRGILFHQGDDSHIAAELYQGRVRISFSPEVSIYHSLLLYSYTSVNDSLPHTLTILIDGKNVSMILDNSVPRFVFSKGDKRYIESRSNFYLGGMPDEARQRAKSRFHIVRTSSFRGCFHYAYINDKLFDFDNVNLVTNQLLPGCGEEEKSPAQLRDPCDENLCANGECVPNYGTMDYACECNRGYSGTTCDQQAVTCTAESYKDYYTDPDTGCRSKGLVKLRRCVGNKSCSVRRTRKKTVKMQCDDKRIYTKEIEIPRKCSRSRRRRL